ncbi:HNH endonuclease [Serratia nematodiphila]
MKKELSIDDLKKVIKYDEATGSFSWLNNESIHPRMRGKVAGTKRKDGYLQINIFGVCYLSHRLAWFYSNGHWPSEIIDHADGNRENNRIANLRLASPCENQYNRVKSKSNSSGAKGVTFCSRSGKWIAKVRLKKEMHFLGRFDDIELASLVANQFREKYHGEFCRHGS